MYYHSVILEKEKCIGCTDCIKRCPTEAIRVRHSKAQIIEERCIDCGNCIRICRNGAKKAATDDRKLMAQYEHVVALPAPSFYAQFPKAQGIEYILEALLKVGFTDYFEVAVAAEVISEATYQYLKEKAQHFPVISSACPVIVRLIQRRFPSLIPHVLPIVSPMELAARYIKHQYEQRGIDTDKVGVFFISPCPAKVTETKWPIGADKSMVDGVLSMQDLYKKMCDLVQQVTPQRDRSCTHRGMIWATRNGGVDEHQVKGYLAVDGMENVIKILENVEDGTLDHMQFIEAMACTGGCLGGALALENAFISRSTLKKWIKADEAEEKTKKVDPAYDLRLEVAKVPLSFEVPIMPKQVFSLDPNRGRALEMMGQIEALFETLPKIDCGCCGAPTCRSFAEDVARGDARLEDCIFMLRRKVKVLSDEMHQLAYTAVPTESHMGMMSEVENKAPHQP